MIAQNESKTGQNRVENAVNLGDFASICEVLGGEAAVGATVPDGCEIGAPPI